MKNLLYIFILSLMFFCCSCNTKNKVTNIEDYEKYLSLNTNKIYNDALKIQDFWTKKIEGNPNQYPYLSKIANAESILFNQTGNISYLVDAEKNLLKLNEKTNFNKASQLRALAKNNITQHKFKEALKYLLLAEKNGEKLIATQKMLFDVYLELGNEEKATTYLTIIEKENDFDYFIRLSKYMDHIGNLTAAIHHLEKAIKIAESSNNKGLKLWAYTNIADYYGHANQIDKSYTYYLKALAINSNEVYALKGIAWILFSYERNATEAMRVINAISKVNISPDYHLLKAEISSFLSNKNDEEIYLNKYFTQLENVKYGNMYNKYKVLLFAENKNEIQQAIQLAKKEVENRPTVQSYDLLAWSYFNNNEFTKAKNMIDKYVINKSSEPEILFHVANIYKHYNELEKVSEIKDELQEAIYELGPLMEENIKRL